MTYFDQIVELAGQLVNSSLEGTVELKTAKMVIKDYNGRAITYRSSGEAGTFRAASLIGEMNRLYAAAVVLLQDSIPVSVHGSSIYCKPSTQGQIELCLALGLARNKQGFYAFHFAAKTDQAVKGIKWVRATIKN